MCGVIVKSSILSSFDSSFAEFVFSASSAALSWALAEADANAKVDASGC